MNIAFLARVLLQRRALRVRDRWSREQIGRHQLKALAALRQFAMQRSPFYRRFHSGREGVPLTELPVLTKGQLMDSFDDIATDSAVRLDPVRSFLHDLDGYRLFAGRFWVARTAGSTGSPGIFVWNSTEWTTVLASYARAQEWAGIQANLVRRTRIAVVSSRTPWHQSALVGLSVDSPFIPVRRFDATQPLDEIVAGLNLWQPVNLVCYASMGRVLAEEQLAGRLAIAPQAVMCSSEVLTAESRARMRRAFGTEPFNVYAATETAGIAAECDRHRMHLFEDLVITEVVDDRNRPVPAGTVGAKVLVTVLFSRTQPLIRYEMSDTIALSDDRCSCGRAFGLVAAIEGRTEDTLVLPAKVGGTVSIHPNVFHLLLEPLPVTSWQVEQRRDRLVIHLVDPSSAVDTTALGDSIKRELVKAGTSEVRVEVTRAAELTRTSLGKAPLIKALT